MDINKMMADAEDAETLGDLWRVYVGGLNLDPNTPETRDLLQALKCAFYSGATSAIVLVQNAQGDGEPEDQVHEMLTAMDDIAVASLRLAQPVM